MLFLLVFMNTNLTIELLYTVLIQRYQTVSLSHTIQSLNNAIQTPCKLFVNENGTV